MRLYEKLLEIKSEELVSFHVPGHKYTKLYEEYLSKLNNILDIDVTEIPGTDDLHSSDGCILDSEKNASEFYQSMETFFLVNGTTCGIYAMIMATTSPGDKIIVSRDCHRAVFDAIQLGGLNAIYVSPEIDENTNLILGLTPEKVRKSISENRDAKAVVLTYPNYNGICCDIEAIVEIVHNNDMLLLVDEAHGAHLKLSEKLPISSLDAGADIVVHSSHKSLPVFTQASMLHLNSEKVSLKKLKYMLKIHQSSSPSYILMTSLDIGMSIIQEHGNKRITELLSVITSFSNKISNLGYKFLDEEYIKSKGFALDKTKLTLLGKESNVDPIDFENKLRENGIQIEFSNENNALFVSTICNEETDFNKLYKTMEKAEYKCYSGVDGIFLRYNSENSISIKEAFYSDKKSVLLKDSIGMISADYIIPYPPGIPILVPGEIIDNKSIEIINNMVINNQKIIGIYETYTTFDTICIEVVLD